MDTMQEPIVILDSNLRVVVGNRAFYDKFGVDYEKINGKKFDKLGTGEWNIPALTSLLSQIIPEKTEVKGYEVVHTFEKLGLSVMVLNARSIKTGEGGGRQSGRCLCVHNRHNGAAQIRARQGKFDATERYAS